VNRRGFLRTALAAGIGFSILPAALTYRRRWVARKSGIIVCEFKMLLIDQIPIYDRVILEYSPDAEGFGAWRGDEFVDAKHLFAGAKLL